MVITLMVIGFAFAWLGYESDWMRVRLPVGAIGKPKYARYEVFNSLTKKRFYSGRIYGGGNLPKDYTPNSEPNYTIVLSPGIDNVLCGFDWLNEHCASMVDYQPKVEMFMAGVRYNMTIKQPAVIKDIMKANHLTRAQKLVYAGAH